MAIQPVGLAVALHDGSDNELGSLAQGLYAGTSVFFVADLAGQHVLEVLKDECRLAAFTDDTGKVLLESGQADRWGFRGLSDTNISEDGRQAQFGFSAEETPAEGATAIKIAATMVFLVGVEEDTASAEGVALAEGGSIAVGDYVFEITGVDDEPWGDDAAIAIDLESSTSFVAIKAIRFFNAASDEVAAETTSWGRYGGDSDYTYTRTINLAEALETATVTIEYYSKTEEVTVPLDVTVGVGL